MNKFIVALLVLLALLVLVALAVVAGQVGGVSIRSASRTHTIGALTTANVTILPGVPMTVTFAGEEIPEDAVTVLLLRLPSASVVVREIKPGELSSGSFVVKVPCDGGRSEENVGETQARLVLVNNENQAVLAQSDQMELLAAGPDCAF